MLDARNRAIVAYNRGLQRTQIGDLMGATEALEEALRENPMHVEARNVLGKVYMHRGEPRRAERCWEQVLIIDPDNFTARECLDALRQRYGRFRMSPRHFFILAGLFAFLVLFGIVYLNLQELNRSVRTIYAALQTQSQNPQKESAPTPATPAQPPATAGRPGKPATLTISNPKRAAPPVPEPKAETEKAPPPTASEKRVPSSTASRQEKKSSLPAREKKSGDHSAASTAAYKQAVAQVFAGHHDQAILLFLELAKDENLPNDLKDNVHFWLGSCYAAQRQYEDGLVHYLKVIREFPEGNKRPEAMIGAANCYARLGRYDQAVALLRRVLDEKPKGIKLKPVEEKLKQYTELIH